MGDANIPDFDDTDLTRDELEEVAEDLGVDTDDLDDQALLERLGVALGEIENGDGDEDGDDADDGDDGDGGKSSESKGSDQGDDDSNDSDDSDDSDEQDGDDGDGDGDGEERRHRLRAKLASALAGAADRVRPDGDDGDGDDGDADGGEDSEDSEDSEDDGGTDGDDGSSEQQQPGEPIDGPTRDELRDKLRKLDLPVSGTKEELLERLEQAEGDASDGDDDEDDDGDGGGGADDKGSDGERPTRKTADPELLEKAKAKVKQRRRDRRQQRLDTARELPGKALEAVKRTARKASSDEDADGDDEQQQPGESIDGPTRDELRDKLRKLGLSVSGAKEELLERLEQAGDDASDEDEGEDEDDGNGNDGGGLRDKLAGGLERTADRLRSSDDS